LAPLREKTALKWTIYIRQKPPVSAIYKTQNTGDKMQFFFRLLLLKTKGLMVDKTAKV